MTAGRPAIPVAEKVRRLTGQTDNLIAPLPFEWENPFDVDEDPESWTAWRFVVQDCMHRNVLANGDRNEVYSYCVFYQRAIQAGREWRGSMTTMDDMGNVKNHPALKVEETSWDRVAKIGGRLGLNPVDRDRPKVVRSKDLAIAGEDGSSIDLLKFARDRQKPPPWERDKDGSPDAS